MRIMTCNGLGDVATLWMVVAESGNRSRLESATGNLPVRRFTCARFALVITATTLQVGFDPFLLTALERCVSRYMRYRYVPCGFNWKEGGPHT